MQSSTHLSAQSPARPLAQSRAYRVQGSVSSLPDGSALSAWREPPGRLGDFVRRIKAYHQIPVALAQPFAGSPYLVSVRASASAAAISA